MQGRRKAKGHLQMLGPECFCLGPYKPPSQGHQNRHLQVPELAHPRGSAIPSKLSSEWQEILFRTLWCVGVGVKWESVRRRNQTLETAGTIYFGIYFPESQGYWASFHSHWCFFWELCLSVYWLKGWFVWYLTFLCSKTYFFFKSILIISKCLNLLYKIS